MKSNSNMKYSKHSSILLMARKRRRLKKEKSELEELMVQHVNQNTSYIVNIKIRAV